MKIFKLFLLSLFSLSLMLACSDDDNNPAGKFGTKEEVNTAISKKWSINSEGSNYRSIEFIAASSATHDGTYTITKKEGNPVTGNYTISTNGESLVLTDLGTINLTKLTSGELNFTLKLTNGDTVEIISTESIIEGKTISIYAHKNIDIPGGAENNQIIKINPSTGDKVVYLDNTVNFEYIDYYAKSNELIGFTNDDNFYYFTKINLKTKTPVKYKLGTYDNNSFYDDFIIVGDKAYVMKEIEVFQSRNLTTKNQLVEVDIANGTETVTINDSDFSWCEYIAYNSSKNEILGISDDDEKYELYKINLSTKSTSRVPIHSNYNTTSFNDLVFANNKLYAFKTDTNIEGNEDYQLVEIDITTGKETIAINKIKWCEYLKYSNETNEIIGFTDDNEEGKYYIYRINLNTLKISEIPFDTNDNQNVSYEDFIIIAE